MARFSVVAMMRESPEIVRRFVDYYRALGAAEVFIYFNGPADELPPVAGATRIDCTAEFWAQNDDMPLENIEDRMRICYRDCKARCTTEWLLIVDADEFLFSDRDIGRLLDNVPDTVDSIGFPTAEAVWGPGDDLEQAFGSTHFRVKWRNERLWRLLRRPLYGRISSEMRWGVIGHVAGKHMIRTAREFTLIGGHRSHRGDEIVTRRARKVSRDWAGTYVGHFDAIGIERWLRKWQWRFDKEVIAAGMSRGRLAQMQMVEKAIATGRTRQLFRRFYGLSALQYRTLALLGYAFRREDFFERAGEAASASWSQADVTGRAA